LSKPRKVKQSIHVKQSAPPPVLPSKRSLPDASDEDEYEEDDDDDEEDAEPNDEDPDRTFDLPYSMSFILTSSSRAQGQSEAARASFSKAQGSPWATSAG